MITNKIKYELLGCWRLSSSQGATFKDTEIKVHPQSMTEIVVEVNWTKSNIVSKNKKYPGNSFHTWVNRGENTLLPNACLATLTIWLCHLAVHFEFLCRCWNKGCFKHKKDSFLFSQIKTLKTAEFKRTKKCFMLTEISEVSPTSKIRH